MNKNLFLIIILMIALIPGVSFAVTRAFFSDTATSTSNTFSAAASFGTPTPTPPEEVSVHAGDVVINEIMWGGSGDEWIELRNMTGNTIDVSNWIIENAGSSGGSITLPDVASIGPNGFYLIAENKNSSSINIDPDHPTAAVSLLDTGEVLTLKDSTNQTIDTANATPNWLAGNNNTPRHSMERVNTPGDGTQAANWQDASTHTNMDGSTATDEFGTPKSANGL